MKRLLVSVDRWGPALIAVITLFVLIAYGFGYEGRLNYLLGRIETLENELNRMERREHQRWQTTETYRLECQALRIEMARAGITAKTPTTGQKKEK